MKIISSFVYAWQGFQHSAKTQLNFRIHLLIMCGVLFAGFILDINITEWLFVIVCSMLVLTLELINTAIEQLCNTVTTDPDPRIKIIKDVSAAAVLLTALGSAAIGLIIFLPKIINLINK